MPSIVFKHCILLQLYSYFNNFDVLRWSRAYLPAGSLLTPIFSYNEFIPNLIIGVFKYIIKDHYFEFLIFFELSKECPIVAMQTLVFKMRTLFCTFKLYRGNDFLESPYLTQSPKPIVIDSVYIAKLNNSNTTRRNFNYDFWSWYKLFAK